ncbi:hypothetical protein Gocc_2523 [Gaiella occulta]|uniref:Uncharacterized protein n=1 Tax=Gaiella occulta TaxID=1002870 RepID=A0A7M2YWK7_9ACTN|nr:hypothetical protein Gocc_2523 [Gaiella occulta]
MGLLAALAVWDASAGALPNVGEWLDVGVVSLLLMPATFLAAWAALPLASARGLVAVAAALGVLSLLLDLAGMGALFNVAKLLALTLAGFWFLQLFEALSWVVLVSLIVPWVDILSVWRGPTDYVISEQPGLFDRISIAFRLPGEEGSANIGPPDILFFALFLATAARFGLRVGWTWLGMAGLLALTLIGTTAFAVDGLPALPAIALGFLLPNLDLLWRAWRGRGLETSSG